MHNCGVIYVTQNSKVVNTSHNWGSAVVLGPNLYVLVQENLKLKGPKT